MTASTARRKRRIKQSRRKSTTKKPNSKLRTIVVWLCSICLSFGLLIWLTFFIFIRVFPSQIRSQSIVITNPSLEPSEGKIYFVHVNTFWPKVTIVEMNPKMMVNLFGGYGEYELRSILPLLKIENKSSHFISSVYSNTLEQNIDFVWQTKKGNVATISDQPNLVLSLANYLRKEVDVDSLSISEKIHFYRYLAGLQPDQVTLERVATWEEWQEITKKMPFEFEQTCSIAVINGTQTSGLAKQVSETLENTGLSVVRITDISDQQTHSRLLQQSETANCSQMLPYVKNIFPTQVKTEENDDVSGHYRADLVIILGEDMVR